MSVSASRWAWDQNVHPVSHKIVLLALADCADENTSEAFPSVVEIEKKTGLTRKAVFLALRDLKTRGLIEPTGEHKGATKQISVYRVKGCKNGNSSQKETVSFTSSKRPQNYTLSEPGYYYA